MNKKEIEIIKEILNIAENNPGGYFLPDEYDEYDESPEDVTVHNASMIRVRCIKLLGIKEK